MRNPCVAVVASIVVLVSAGCQSLDTFQRAKDHIQPMKPVYERGVTSYDGEATPSEQKIMRDHMIELEKLFEAGGAK